jgi:hypothetical protein
VNRIKWRPSCRNRNRPVCGWHFRPTVSSRLKMKGSCPAAAVGPVPGLRRPFLGIDVCGVLLRYGIIYGGSALNNSRTKSIGLFRPILLDLPSTSEQNLQLIEVVEVFWLHNTPYGQAAAAQALETHREISAVSVLVLSTNMASTSNRRFFSGVGARINEIDGLSQPRSKVQRESESLKVDTSPRYQRPRIDEYGRTLHSEA